MKKLSILVSILLVSAWSSALATTNLPMPAELFEVNGRQAFVMPAKGPATGKPWVWYAPTLKNLPNDGMEFFKSQDLLNFIFKQSKDQTP